MKNQTLIAPKYAFDGSDYFEIIQIVSAYSLRVRLPGFETFFICKLPDSPMWVNSIGDQFYLTASK